MKNHSFLFVFVGIVIVAFIFGFVQVCLAILDDTYFDLLFEILEYTLVTFEFGIHVQKSVWFFNAILIHLLPFFVIHTFCPFFVNTLNLLFIGTLKENQTAHVVSYGFRYGFVRLGHNNE